MVQWALPFASLFLAWLPGAILCTLAFFELQKHDAIRELAGLAPLCLADRSHFGPGVLDRLLRGYLRLWQRLL